MINSTAYWIEKRIGEVEDRFEEIIRNFMQGDKRDRKYQ